MQHKGVETDTRGKVQGERERTRQIILVRRRAGEVVETLAGVEEVGSCLWPRQRRPTAAQLR